MGRIEEILGSKQCVNAKTSSRGLGHSSLSINSKIVMAESYLMSLFP